jgi:hypothetical protein
MNQPALRTTEARETAARRAQRVLWGIIARLIVLEDVLMHSGRSSRRGALDFCSQRGEFRFERAACDETAAGRLQAKLFFKFTAP